MDTASETNGVIFTSRIGSNGKVTSKTCDRVGCDYYGVNLDEIKDPALTKSWIDT